LRRHTQRIIAAEEPPQEEVRRGHTFVIIYGAGICLPAPAFVALALIVRAQGVLQLDVTIERAVQSNHLPPYEWVLTHASDIGFPPLNYVAYSVVFLALFALGLRVEAVLAIASSLLAGAVGAGVRLLVARARPAGPLIHVAAPLGGYSFPSGHVIMYSTLFGLTFYAVPVSWRSDSLRNVVLVLLMLPVVPVVLVGPSRVYLGEHWPSDVVGAYLFASVWLAGTIELDLWHKRRVGRRKLHPAQPRQSHGAVVKRSRPRPASHLA
jgi:undecaprenyl-diphosphatase